SDPRQLAGPVRFSEFVHLVPGLSERMLAERLSELTAAGLVERAVGNGPPVTVRYVLTVRGQALRPALAELERWGQEQLVNTVAPAPGNDAPAGRPGRSHSRAELDRPAGP
ncbi:MAG: winged helix-turn-helix transcriptional regulator, partial [Acidimicrobiales bacterium]